MKRNSRNICLQSTLRQRVRTLFLLLLVGLISFAFISRAVEYLVVERETDRLAGYYRSIGIMEMENAIPIGVRTDNSTDWTVDEWPEATEAQKTHNEAVCDDAAEGVELVANSRYVAFADRRRLVHGVLQGLYNADVANHGYHRCVGGVLVYGELLSMSHSSLVSQFRLKVDQVAAGYPEHAQEGSSICIRYFPDSPGELDTVFDSLQVGQRYLVRAYYNSWDNNHEWQKASDNLLLEPLNDNGLWFLPVEPGALVDFADPVLAALAEKQRALEENQRTMMVYTTKDMSAMPAVQEASRDLYLAEGRWLNRNDDIEGRRVCVVHRDFAALRCLALGDSITVKLRELPSGRIYIIPRDDSDDWKAWQEYETHTEEFEIVGLYCRLAEGYQATFSSNYMYIPDSSLPAGYGDSLRGIGPSNYSFVLHSPWDEEAFLAENQNALEELGLPVSFFDTGWDSFQASVVPIKQSAALSAIIFTLVLVLALALAAFLYLRQRRRDFAILRSLGVPRRTAIRQMLQPMVLIGAVSILMGGLVAWFYALGKAAGTLASLQGPEGVGLSTALSPAWLAGLFTAVFTLLLLFTTVGTVMTARSPVLELLQGVAKQGGGKRKPAAEVVQESQKAGAQEMQFAPARAISFGEAPAPARNLGLAQVPRYVFQHTRRAPMKSILTVAVALSFTLALGWMSWIMERNDSELDRLYSSIQVEAEIIQSNPSLYVSGGFIRYRTVDSILASGFVESAYLEAAATAPRVAATDEEGKRDDERMISGVQLRSFDQPKQFFALRGSDVTVEYATGWDEDLFARDWTEEDVPPVLLPEFLMGYLRLQPGDVILIYSSNTVISGSYVVAGQYTGIVSGGSADLILLPTSTLWQLEGYEMRYSKAEFVLDPAKNRELPEFRAKMDSLFNSGVAGTVPLTFLFWDEELTQVVEPLEKNLQLMEILFPVTVAVSVLIAAGLAVLLIFQTSKEAALMRVLGTTKGRARAMLCGEQLLLCILGLGLGLTALIFLRQDAVAVLAGPAMLSAALYLIGVIGGSIPSAVSVTNRMPLELLQVKE